MTIPISRIVSVTPSALAPAAGVSFINGLILTKNVLTPGELRVYSDPASVAKDFTASSTEAAQANAYFMGYTGALRLPGKLYFYGVAHAAETGEGGDGPTSGPTMTDDAATVMNKIVDMTQDFVGFTTAWELSAAEKQAMATWTGGKADRYWNVVWDTDPQAVATASNNASFGAWLVAQAIDGTTAVWKDPAVAAFCLGWAASLDFDATNGRATLADRRSPVLTAADDSADDYDALMANGYSVYGAFGNGLGRWNLLRAGAVSGQFLWADSYIDQIWLNASLQADLVNLLTSVGTIPYNADGDGLMSASVANTREQARAFGAVRAGVALTDLQKSELQRLFNRDISAELFSTGDYFQPNASTTPADVRVKRGSPPALYAWCDGESVQTINLSSIQVL